MGSRRIGESRSRASRSARSRIWSRPAQTTAFRHRINANDSRKELFMQPLIVFLIALGVIALLLIAAAIRVAREYEGGVVSRLGRLLPQPKGPGLFLLIPIIDRMVRVDLRTITLNIPPQEVITKDNVTARVNAVAYFRILDPSAAIVQVENFLM